MEFLKNAALHTPPEHYQLLLFMMNLVFILLLPYLGFLLGTSVLSYFYNRRGLARGNDVETRWGNLLIDTALASKGLVIILLVIPALSLVFLLAQLLQETPSIAVTLMGSGFLLLLASAILLYAYKLTYRLAGLLNSYSGLLRKTHAGGPEELENLSGYSSVNQQTHLRAGLSGNILLLIGSFLTIGAITISGDPDAWSSVESLFNLLLYAPFWLRFAQFLVIAMGVTGVGILFIFFSWGKRLPATDHEIVEIARRDGLRLAFVSVFLQPLVLILTVAELPSRALSGLVFGLSGLALALFFVSAHFIYAFKKEPRSGYAACAFYTLMLALILLVTKDQIGISNATREQSVRLAVAANKETEDLRATLGVVLVKALSGQEIYDVKCSACHLFDARKIGPAYKDVIPKYEGKKTQLSGFILNPVKVDPAFPSMPNQGLRPPEADSIASFLLAKFTGKPAQGATGRE